MSGGAPRGWSLVAWTGLVVGAGAACILAWQGVGEEGLRLVLRATARTSLLLFLAVFLASTLRGGGRTARPSGSSTTDDTWASRSRRLIPMHFAAILALTRDERAPPRPRRPAARRIGIPVHPRHGGDVVRRHRRVDRRSRAGSDLHTTGSSTSGPCSCSPTWETPRRILGRPYPSSSCSPRSRFAWRGGVRRTRTRPPAEGGLMRRAPRLATLATLLWLIGGCHSDRVTRREPPLRRAKPECPAASGDECRAHCGSTGGAAPGSSEGKCEAVLDDLCRSHCEAACGEATAYSRTAHRRTGADPREPVRQRPACGIRGKRPLPRPAPTPHPLNDLMRGNP